MQFILTAYDFKDEGLQRRELARSEHIAYGDELKKQGHYLMGVALLDENDLMIGSVMILDFSTRNELDIWLKSEPYVVHNVWETIDIRPCRVGPSFASVTTRDIQ